MRIRPKHSRSLQYYLSLIPCHRTTSWRCYATKFKEMDKNVRVQPFLSTGQFALFGVATFSTILGYKIWTHESMEPPMLTNIRTLLESNSEIEEKVGDSLEYLVNQNLYPPQAMKRGLHSVDLTVKGSKGTAQVAYIAEEDIRMPSERDHDAPWKLKSLQVTFQDNTTTSIIDFPHGQTGNPSALDNGKLNYWQVLAMVAIGLSIGTALGVYGNRLLVNRGTHVYDVALGMVKNNASVIQALGVPIKSSRKDFSGKILSRSAQFQFSCSGPLGHGMALVQAYREDEDQEDWRFVYMKVSAPGIPNQIDILQNKEENNSQGKKR